MSNNLNDSHARDQFYRLGEMARRYRLPFRFLLDAIRARRLRAKLGQDGWFISRAAMQEFLEQLPGKRSAA